jgi:predicted transcriptional regulator
MGRGKSRQPDKLLTEVELELMTILWDLGGGTAGEVQERLPADRPLAYTSVSTILRILEQKGVLAAEKAGRGHRYIPQVARHEYQVFALRDVVGRVFGGQPLELVRRLVSAEALDPAQLAELGALLAGRERRRADGAERAIEADDDEERS